MEKNGSITTGREAPAPPVFTPERRIKEDLKMIAIYYIEDDESIAGMVKEYLEQRGCKVSVFRTITDAREAFLGRVPDAALVDWNMPDGRGDALCRWIRSKWKELPVIFLTARGDTREVVSDDYVVKPFELEVLDSRIRALLRRAGNVSGQCLTCGSIMLDQNRMMVFIGEEEIVVSQSEYQLLLLLIRNKGKTVTRERILSDLWDKSGSYVNDNTLTVTMKRLREKLHNPSCIKTVRSFGYRMEDNRSDT